MKLFVFFGHFLILPVVAGLVPAKEELETLFAPQIIKSALELRWPAQDRPLRVFIGKLSG